ncbi:hypothetical protein [Cutibacterium sp. V970]|uniref:hypothetical protein n=2 Tax=unclassified Cutibacterium TaxID=2649671 RepID=UPI003F4F4C94
MVDIMSFTSAGYVSDAVGRLKTDRAVVWIAVVMTGLLIAIRLWTQLADRISQVGWTRGHTSGLEDPALAQLAVRLGIVFAMILSTVFQGLYLFLCAVVDEKILQGTMVPVREDKGTDGKTGLGPAVFVGLCATVPVQLVALIANVSAPKEYPATFVWLFAVAVATIVWTWRRPAMGRAGTRGKVTSAALLLAVGAISLVL